MTKNDAYKKPINNFVTTRLSFIRIRNLAFIRVNFITKFHVVFKNKKQKNRIHHIQKNKNNHFGLKIKIKQFIWTVTYNTLTGSKNVAFHREKGSFTT